MCEDQTVRIESEEIVRVSIPMPKRIVEFLREYGEWVGFDGNIDEFVGEFIVEAVEASIYGALDRMREVAPLKVEYFRRKYKV